jgi:hypothetical protein
MKARKKERDRESALLALKEKNPLNNILPVDCTEPVFLNVYEAQKSIPRNKFRQPI